MKQLRKRLTYANVMSSIAVFFVLTGVTAFAATQLGKNSVGSKQLKKNAVTTAKIKNNAVTTGKIKNGAVTGPKINLGSLGTVPSATNASHAGTSDHATNAGNASTVGGVAASKINYNVDDSGPVVIFSRAGLTLVASCDTDITITATTSKPDASIYTSVVDTDGDDNNSNDDLESGNFDLGESFDLLAENDGNPGLITFEYDANDGTTVTGNIAVDLANLAGGDCQAHGIVFSA